MNIRPFEKKRMIFTGVTLFILLMITQFFGYESIFLTGALAGIVGGLSVILYPDPDREP